MKRLAQRKKKKGQKKNGNIDKLFKIIAYVTVILKLIIVIKDLIS